jgi:hypothetical protein
MNILGNILQYAIDVVVAAKDGVVEIVKQILLIG